jgi:hypothetical protein
MALPDLKKQYIQMLCERWNKTPDYILGLAIEGKLALNVELYDVRVEGFQHYNTGNHELFQLTLLPKELAYLARANDARIEQAELSGYGPEGYGNEPRTTAPLESIKRNINNFIHLSLLGDGSAYRDSYAVRVHKLNSGELLLVNRSVLFAHLEDIKKFDDVPKESSGPFVEDKQEATPVTKETISPRRETTLLKVVGALFLLKYDLNEYKTGGGNINASKLADQFIKDISTMDLNDTDMTSTTLRKNVIQQAIEAVRENRGK